MESRGFSKFFREPPLRSTRASPREDIDSMVAWRGHARLVPLDKNFLIGTAELWVFSISGWWTVRSEAFRGKQDCLLPEVW